MNILQVKNLELIKNLEILYKYDIYVYGAAYKGRMVNKELSQIGLEIRNFCDGDNAKWNSEWDGKKVISPMELKKRAQSEEIIILIASSLENDIFGTLCEYEVKCNHVYTVWGLQYAIYMNLNNKKIPENYRCAYSKSFIVQKYMAAHQIREMAAGFLKAYYDFPERGILVFQPGKTASSSLVSTLKAKDVNYIKSHNVIYPSHIFQGALEKEWDFFRKSIRKERVKIISAVREPIARDYSAFWQALTEDKYGGSKGLYSGVLESDFENVYYKFVGYIMDGYERVRKKLKEFAPFVWRDELLWFDEELKEGLGIDIYQYPFNKKKGYSIIEQGNIEILVLKVEQIEKNLDVIAQFVGEDSLEMVKDNISAKKSLHWAYDELRENIVLPENYVDYYYCSNGKMDHFYTKEEKKFFLEKWNKNRHLLDD